MLETVTKCHACSSFRACKVNHRQAHEMVEQIRKSRVGSLFNGVGIKERTRVRSQHLLALSETSPIYGISSRLALLAKEGREAQRLAVEETRLGIPLIFGSVASWHFVALRRAQHMVEWTSFC